MIAAHTATADGDTVDCEPSTAGGGSEAVLVIAAHTATAAAAVTVPPQSSALAVWNAKGTFRCWAFLLLSPFKLHSVGR